MKTLRTIQPYCIWGTYAFWLFSLFFPYRLMGNSYSLADVTINLLPILGGVNLLLALLCKRWKSALASLPLLVAFFVTWFVGDLVFGLLDKLGWIG